MPHPSNRVECVCVKCGGAFNVPASRLKHSPAKFCSVSCKKQAWADGEATTWKPTITKPCEFCGKSITVLESGAKRKRFCSQVCLRAWRDAPERAGERATVPKVPCTCEWCGAGFERYPSELAGGRGRFCSRECGGAWGVRQQGRESQLERDFAQMLREQGLTFETQFPFKRFCLDLAFPALKLAVEVDGDYWHSLPNVQAKDKRKDAALHAAGWRVLHVPERGIRSAPHEAIQSVLTALAQ